MNLEVKFTQAATACEKKDFNTARKILDDIVKTYPLESEPYRLLGQIEYEEGNDDKALYSIGLKAIQETWITTCPTLPYECTCKIRYRQPDVACTIYREDDGNLRVMFKNPVAAVAPGQSVVFYQGLDCLGGAVIDKHIKE